MSYRNYRGINGPAVQFTDTEKVQEKIGEDYKVPRSIVRPDIAKELGVYEARVQPEQDKKEQ